MTIWDCLNTIRIRRAAALIVYSVLAHKQIASEMMAKMDVRKVDED